MRSVFIPRTGCGFSVIEGELCEVVLKRVIFKYTEQGRIETLQVETKSDNKLHNADGKNFYASAEKFEEGLFVPFDHEIFLSRFINGEFADGANYVWVFENGEPVRKAIDFTEITVDVEPRYNISSPDLPNETYNSREECLSLNDYTVHYGDGTTKVVQGVANLCALTEEQRALVDEIETLFDKAIKMGIRFVQDYTGAYVFNASNLEDYALDCDSEYSIKDDNGKRIDYEFVDLTLPRFQGRNPIGYVSSDDDKLFVRRKDD